MIAVLLGLAALALLCTVAAVLLAATGGPALMTHTTYPRTRAPKEG